MPVDSESPPYLLAFVAAAVVLALKAPDSISHPQFWAEDGAIFFVQQHGRRLPLLFEPYGSYLLLLPRAVAWIASFFSAASAPAIYQRFAWIVGSFALASLRHLRIRGVPFFFLLAVIALTPTNGEIFGNLTNVQWLLQLYLWTSVARVLRGTPSRLPWLRAVIALFVGGTGPFVIFAVVAAVPIFLWERRIARRDSREPVALAPEAWVFVACALAQLASIGASQAISASHVAIVAKDVARLLGLVQVHLFSVEHVPRPLFRVLLISSFAAALVLAPSRQSRLLLVALQLFVGLEGLAILRKFAGHGRDFDSLINGDRYFFAIKVLFWWQLASVLAAIPKLSENVRLSLVLAALGLTAAFQEDTLARHPLSDLDWAEHARRIDRGEEVAAPLHPDAWELRLPAERSVTHRH